MYHLRVYERSFGVVGIGALSSGMRDVVSVRYYGGVVLDATSFIHCAYLVIASLRL